MKTDSNESGAQQAKNVADLRSKARLVALDISRCGTSSKLGAIAIADALWSSGKITTSVHGEAVRIIESTFAD